MSTPLPKIVQDDPWLEQYADVIVRRKERLAETTNGIRKDHGSLAGYATMHERAGIIFNQAQQQWIIREWAPSARDISLFGDFNDWNRESHPLAPIGGGMWQLVLPADALKHGQRIKLHIHGANGWRLDRIPACIRRVIQDEGGTDFSGQVWWPEKAYEWQNNDYHVEHLGAPRIYEAHIGMAGEHGWVHTYREFADILPRIVDAGYNTVQFMAIAEHPYYGSFGYHVSSFFAPSSRFGTPEDLKYLVDTAHGLGLAVLMDIVHSHAVKNYAEGLNDFDGSGNQYFHADGRGEHSAWDSKCFDYGRPEVQRFLLSNIRYWLEEFRFDGFRFDGVTSMLYWHRGHTSFDHGDKYFRHLVDEDAILYLGMATTLANEIRPGAVLVAEDMSGMTGLCRPVNEGGIGFTHRLAMGIPDYWIKLLKEQKDEDWNLEEIWGTLGNRRYGEANIAYAESHDQALVGDKTLAFQLMDQEMYWHMHRGDQHHVIERGIALHKIIRLMTLAVGGEGWLNFMGNEFGHPEWIDFPREGNGWSFHHCRRQWSLRDNPDLRYGELADFDKALMNMAAETKLLSADFAKLLHIHNSDKVIAFERGGLLFAFNFSHHQSFADYGINLAPIGGGVWRPRLDTDRPEFGGHGRNDIYRNHHSQGDAPPMLHLYLPARTAQVYERAPK